MQFDPAEIRKALRRFAANAYAVACVASWLAAIWFVERMRK